MARATFRESHHIQDSKHVKEVCKSGVCPLTNSKLISTSYSTACAESSRQFFLVLNLAPRKIKR